MVKEPIVKWIVDSRLLQDRTQEMVGAIENHGMVATVVDSPKNVESIYKLSDCVLAVGCIESSIPKRLKSKISKIAILNVYGALIKNGGTLTNRIK